MTNDFFYDITNPKIQSLKQQFEAKAFTTEIELAQNVYEYVRDNWQYSPLRLSLIDSEYSSNFLIDRPQGHCIDKSVLLITILKSLGIKARLGLAKVKNHIAAERIIDFLGTDVLVPHGYVEIFLENKWVKATPAFNKTLCEKLNVPVLEFNGREDSIFQSFGNDGNNFMEYIEDYGSFETVPLEFIESLLHSYYPILKEAGLEMGTVIDMSGQ